MGITITAVLQTTAPSNMLAILQLQARRQFDSLLEAADREFLLKLNLLLARLNVSMNRSR